MRLSMRDLVSGAGHDAAHAAAVAPRTMIFVPCKDGLSRNTAESTTPEECAAGTQVLLNVVLGCDRRMAEARKEAVAMPRRGIRRLPCIASPPSSALLALFRIPRVTTSGSDRQGPEPCEMNDCTTGCLRLS
ncbi:M20/M25/M40 family metallo-hydrolase [Paracoccus yeei]|uniref:M20/M25/M40 family metallo-hydrolase n=1 Tax=Paracoccus yeei TaxID=147645 RepID=UPI0020C269FE|nr:M20/M25/M40 family metallo-hydrolase [Paracoccus yeei]